MLLLAVPAVALAGVAMAAFFGRWVWWLDVLANFRVQYLVGLTVLGILLMVGKWRRTGLTVLLAAAVNLVVVLPLFAGSPGDSDVSRLSVRIMSFNLLSTNQQFAEVLEYIAAIEPDIVLLHEASRPWEVAAAEASGNGYQVIRPRSDDLIFGTLVLVRGDVEDWESHGFATTQPRAVEVTFVPSGWSQPLRVLSSHPLAPTDGERARVRDEQLEFVTEWAARQEGAFVVAGDLNVTPWSWAFRHLEGSTDLRNSQIGFGLQTSYPVDSNPMFRIAIDHLLHSGVLGVRDRQLGPPLGSDHYPLIVELELRRPG